MMPTIQCARGLHCPSGEIVGPMSRMRCRMMVENHRTLMKMAMCACRSCTAEAWAASTLVRGQIPWDRSEGQQPSIYVLLERHEPQHTEMTALLEVISGLLQVDMHVSMKLVVV